MAVTKFLLVLLIMIHFGVSQNSKAFKKRVLETTEIDFLTSYYSQEGKNAAVSGGIGDEALTDFTPTLVISYPLNDDDIITLEFGLSVYTSASSSNVDPFDGKNKASPFQTSTGASKGDKWINLTGSYSHSSDDRNKIWTSKLSLSNEYDYSSIGIGGSYSQLFNQKNTELSVNGNIYFDSWGKIYPVELRSFTGNGNGLNNELFNGLTITGNSNYNPGFNAHNSSSRNSFSFGMGISQILSKYMQGSFVFDIVKQNGLLSTPFQRVYFSDVQDSFIESFQLADDIEQLPDNRFKIAAAGRLNYYINEMFVLKSYYRFYKDDWGVVSNTSHFEIPIKITDEFTLYPSYRYYDQSAADYFGAYETHLSTDKYYSSDYDLSKFSANQFGIGIKYNDVFVENEFYGLGLKNISLHFNTYKRNTGLSSYIISFSTGFELD